MRMVFVIFMLLHSAIHLLGFLKAFDLIELKAMNYNISKSIGMLWLISFILFFVCILLFLTGSNYWWLLGIMGTIVSQILIFNHWKEAKYGTIANMLILLVSIIGSTTWNYYSKFQNDIKSIVKESLEDSETILEEKDLVNLPEVVQKYIRYSGSVGKPKVYNFKIEFEGKIRKNEKSDWMLFKSEQYNFVNKAARLFFMKAEMKHLPVTGYHSYINSKASMDIRLFSIFKVQYMDGPEMDKAETVTFFNDMCCMAPATLIDNRIKWHENGKNSVKAIFTNNKISISAQLYFNDEGQLINFISNDRYAADVHMELPWETPLKNYKIFNGFTLAGYAETINQYPDRKLTYGVFETKNVKYNIK